MFDNMTESVTYYKYINSTTGQSNLTGQWRGTGSKIINMIIWEIILLTKGILQPGIWTEQDQFVRPEFSFDDEMWRLLSLVFINILIKPHIDFSPNMVLILPRPTVCPWKMFYKTEKLNLYSLLH